MRTVRTCIFTIPAVIVFVLGSSSLTVAQSALDKFGADVFGQKSVDAYSEELAKVGARLEGRESENQRASRTAQTFLILLRSARSTQEYSILDALRPTFNVAWNYLMETGSLTGQLLGETSFGKALPTLFGQSQKIISFPQAAAEFILGEASVIAPYGRSAGQFFVVWRSDRSIKDGDLNRLAIDAKGISERVARAENKALLVMSEGMLDIVVGLATIGGDLAAARKSGGWGSRTGALLSVPGGVSQVMDGIKKLLG
jgi:hypothetical protein